MNVDRAQIFPALLALGLLTGCAPTVVPPDVSMTGMPNAELSLRRTLDQVNGEMTQIGGMRPASYAAVTAAAPVLPGELQKPVQFVWTGPLDAGVRKLATSIGYTVVVSAPDNAQLISVAINIDGQVIGAFRALGDQAGTTATVQVDPQHRQVQVIHHV